MRNEKLTPHCLKQNVADSVDAPDGMAIVRCRGSGDGWQADQHGDTDGTGRGDRRTISIELSGGQAKNPGVRRTYRVPQACNPSAPPVSEDQSRRVRAVPALSHRSECLPSAPRFSRTRSMNPRSAGSNARRRAERYCCQQVGNAAPRDGLSRVQRARFGRFGVA